MDIAGLIAGLTADLGYRLELYPTVSDGGIEPSDCEWLARHVQDRIRLLCRLIKRGLRGGLTEEHRRDARA